MLTRQWFKNKIGARAECLYCGSNVLTNRGRFPLCQDCINELTEPYPIKELKKAIAECKRIISRYDNKELYHRNLNELDTLVAELDKIGDKIIDRVMGTYL